MWFGPARHQSNRPVKLGEGTANIAAGRIERRINLAAHEIQRPVRGINLLGAANELRTFKQAFPSSRWIGRVNLLLPDIERRLAAATK